MKKQKKRKRPSSANRFGRLPWALVVMAAGCLAVGAVTAVSRQLAVAKTSPEKVQSAALVEKTSKNYVTVKVAGRDVQVDSQTGQIKPLTPEEAKQLADGLKVMLNKSTEGLVQVKHEDGSVSMDLAGRFQNVMIAKVNEDGSLTQSCVDNPQAAASFFGIDPQLLGVESSGKPPSNQSARLTPAKSAIK